MRCGTRFIGPWCEAPNFDECVNCWYNLTGNAPGRFSECGWKLPRRYLAYRRKMDQDGAGYP